MPKCSFCAKQIRQGRGIVFVDIQGKIYNFCSSKCKRNWRLGREQRKVKWVKKKKKEKKKE